MVIILQPTHDLTYVSNDNDFIGDNYELKYGAEEYGNNNGKFIIQEEKSDIFHEKESDYAKSIINYFKHIDTVIMTGNNIADIMYQPVGENNDNQLKFYNKVIDDDDKSFILIDDTKSKVARYGNDNFISVSFSEAQVGFLAGILASVYTTAVHEIYSYVTYANFISIWGENEENSISYLSGFEQAVNWFNWYYYDYEIGTEEPVPAGVVKITPYKEKVSYLESPLNYEE